MLIEQDTYDVFKFSKEELNEKAVKDISKLKNYLPMQKIQL